MSTGATGSPGVDDLRRFLGEVLAAAEIVDLERLSGGASRETWRFVAGGEPLILQRQRSGDTRDMAREAAIVRVAERSAVPVAPLIASGDDPSGAGYMISRAVAGETIARKILRDEEYADARHRLAGQLGAAAAAIHRIDVAALPDLDVVDPLARSREILDLFDQPHPTFELVLRWLDDHRPPTRATALVHGDFRLGNVIVGEDGLRAVLDWELAHLGDPMEDLGWLCVRAWRFGSDRPVAGVGDYEELFAAYEAAGGSPVDPEVVRWWEVVGTLSWGVMCMVQASAHLTGQVRSHELAAIGRRVCENEYDLFLALEGRW